MVVGRRRRRRFVRYVGLSFIRVRRPFSAFDCAFIVVHMKRAENHADRFAPLVIKVNYSDSSDGKCFLAISVTIV